jgi:cell wall-associated NlpC family hydrolase
MKKLSYIFIIEILFLVSCSGPVRRSEYYPKPLPEKSAKRLIKEAARHIGEPYCYGGLSKKGWDCSGFVRTIYQRSLNIALPRTADEMYQLGFKIPFNHAHPGDLLFFKIGRKNVSHVGIFMGDGRFIHVSKTDGVIVSSISDPYYQGHFLDVRRLPPQLIALRK